MSSAELADPTPPVAGAPSTRDREQLVGIREVARGAPERAIDLSLGEPSWPLPEVARVALTEAMARPAPCGYGPNDGLPELVGAVAEQHDTVPDQVMVTSGSQAALFALFAAHLSPGAAVLVPDPGFPGYATLTRQGGGEVVRYPLGEHGGLDAEAFEATLEATPHARVAVLNHPGNPTGGGATTAALAQVAAACRARGVLLISDEVYRELHLGPRPPSLREVSAEGVVVSSVSKAWAAPGLRVGWALGAAELLAPAREAHRAMTTAPARPSQVAATALLRASEEVVGESWKHLVRRWSVAQTAPEPVRATRTPAGGFYHWLPLPPWALDDPVGFCRRVRDEGLVVVVPGMAFGPAGAGHVRISCGVGLGELAAGLARLAPWWGAP